MFWTRSNREARRQKVLDELLELDPSQRLLRLEQAVAAGDVRPNEVDAALVLVRRLDALRVMTPNSGGESSPAANVPGTSRASTVSRKPVPARAPVAAHQVAAPVFAASARKSVTAKPASPRKPGSRAAASGQQLVGAVPASRASATALNPLATRKVAAPANSSMGRASILPASTQPPGHDYATIRIIADREPLRPPEPSPVAIESAVSGSRLIESDLAAYRARTGSFSSRQRRLRALAEGGSSAGRATSVAAEALDEHAPDGAAAPSWPDISWLRP